MTGTTTCRDGVSVLMDYTEGLLPVAKRRSVEKHVDGCRRCQGFLRSYLATPRILRHATRISMPAAAKRRLHGIITEISPRRGRGPRRT